MNRSSFVGCLAITVRTLIAAAPAQVPTGLIDEIAARATAITRLDVQFTILMTPSPKEHDPFDRSKWEVSGPQTACCKYSARVVRPHFRIDSLGSAGSGVLPCPDRDTQAWVDGQRTALGYSQTKKSWSATIDADLSKSFGPVPILAALELQVLGLQEDLVSLLRRGRLSIESEDAINVVLAGNAVYDPPDPPWNVRIVLDKTRGFVPVEGRTWVTLSGGIELSWNYRVTETQRVASAWAIKRLVMASFNSALDWPKWQIFEFEAQSIDAAESLTKQALIPEIPTKNVTVLNEIDLYYRRIGESGQILEEQKWTPEQRAKQRQGILEAEAANRVAPEIRSSRQNLFITIAVASACLAGGLLLWTYRRRARLIRGS